MLHPLLISLSLVTFPQDTSHVDAAHQPSRMIWADYDLDGFDDLYVLTPGARDSLLKNAGDGTFSDVTELVGLADQFASRSALWKDADGDGRPDLLLVSAEGQLRFFRGMPGASTVDVGAHESVSGL